MKEDGAWKINSLSKFSILTKTEASGFNMKYLTELSRNKDSI